MQAVVRPGLDIVLKWQIQHGAGDDQVLAAKPEYPFHLKKAIKNYRDPPN